MKLDLRSLALSRIFIGSLLIVDCLFRLQNFDAHYSDFGVMPLALLQELYAPTGFCLHCWNASDAWLLGLFALQILFAFTMAIGWKTRCSTFASWILTVSLHYRNPLVLDGGDVLIRCFLFWLMFLPTAELWSADSGFKKIGDLKTATCFSVTFATLPVQLFVLYFFSAILKTGADWWPDGTASGYALSLDAFVTPFGHWLTQFPETLRFLTRAVFIIELWGGFLFFAPGGWRAFAVFLFIGFHTALGLALDLALFPWIAAACLISVLPTEFWDWIQPNKIMSSGMLQYRSRERAYAWSWVAMPFLALIVSWNVLSYRGEPMWEPLRRTALYIHLDQYWGMFAPFPLKDSGWYEFGVHQWNGNYVYTFVDPRMESAWDGDRARPVQGNRFFVDQRWRKYLVNLWERNNAKFRPGLASYLCRKWNRDYELPSDKAVAVDIDFKLSQNETYLAPPRAPAAVDLGSYPCANESRP